MDELQRLNIWELFEKAAREGAARFVLRLYITGKTPNSVRAVQNARNICESYLAGRYELQIVDLYQDPEQAKHDQVVAVPTLVRKEPGPVRRIIGDLSNTARVLEGLEIAVAG